MNPWTKVVLSLNGTDLLFFESRATDVPFLTVPVGQLTGVNGRPVSNARMNVDGAGGKPTTMDNVDIMVATSSGETIIIRSAHALTDVVCIFI